MSNNNEPTTFEEAFKRYIEYRTRFEHLENEFDEYQQSSLNYEQELEVQLKQLDNQAHRLQQDLFLERTQNEQYRERSEQTIKQFDKRFDQIQAELNSCKNLNEKLTHYIRELEQTNDDLERSKRTLLDSLSTFETKLNRALEQNALLEDELDEKQQLTETVQRLRDETRDLSEELDVLHKTNKEKATNSNETPIVNSNRMKSILSEAAATNSTITRDSNIQQDLLNVNLLDDQKPDLSTSKPPLISITTDLNRTISTSIDSQLIKGNDFYQPVSNSTRLESLKLIGEAFRRFTTLESTLLAQRKQSQMTTSTHSTRSRFNSTTNANYNKNNESIRTETHS
ncbi:unnamed protein product [Rotaria sordida]|uniref:NUDE domain-containing protein n=1 Tax=Rotaria sordida TaxID=392033 RepID=A0A813WTT8_9BILA|nr:unnamed protein product [Rotaria sordida]CAF0809141.1 unnamed protein product [Rotaria sordida]CAF0863188.1 unnamed protein product [Rotaria sordida]CAF0864614.1 unnamed protein product [Rotaria sordida]CAF0908665.1 unnamed protein product [Rotaria sordida]